MVSVLRDALPYAPRGFTKIKAISSAQKTLLLRSYGVSKVLRLKDEIIFRYQIFFGQTAYVLWQNKEITIQVDLSGTNHFTVQRLDTRKLRIKLKRVLSLSVPRIEG